MFCFFFRLFIKCAVLLHFPRGVNLHTSIWAADSYAQFILFFPLCLTICVYVCINILKWAYERRLEFEDASTSKLIKFRNSLQYIRYWPLVYYQCIEVCSEKIGSFSPTSKLYSFKICISVNYYHQLTTSFPLAVLLLIYFLTIWCFVCTFSRGFPRTECSEWNWPTFSYFMHIYWNETVPNQHKRWHVLSLVCWRLVFATSYEAPKEKREYKT